MPACAGAVPLLRSFVYLWIAIPTLASLARGYCCSGAPRLHPRLSR